MPDDEFDYGEEPERQEWDSGPFCRHWSDPSDCDIACTCGHECRQHNSGEDSSCSVENCNCKEFTEA